MQMGSMQMPVNYLKPWMNLPVAGWVPICCLFVRIRWAHFQLTEKRALSTLHAYKRIQSLFTHTHTHRFALICLIKLHSDKAFDHSQFSNHSLAHSREKQTNVNTDAVLHMWECVCVPWLEVELRKHTHMSTFTLTNTDTHTLHIF